MKMQERIAIVVAAHDGTERICHGGVTRGLVSRPDGGRKHHRSDDGSSTHGDALCTVCVSLIWQRDLNTVDVTIAAVE
jgi:hypothetical protein